MKIKIKNTQKDEFAPVAHKPKPVKKNTPQVFNKEEKKRSNVHYLLYFFAAVAVCIIVVLLFRLFVTVKNSTFSTPSYSVLVWSTSPFIISADTSSRKLSLVDISHSNMEYKPERLRNSIPIDGLVYKKKGALKSFEYPSFGFLWSVVLRPWEFRFINMSPFDAFKLTQFALGVKEKDVKREAIEIDTDGVIQNMTPGELYELFKDPAVINEQQSIEVLNGTGREGLAGQVSQIIRTTGGNVVSVGTAKQRDSTLLTANKNSITLTRLSRILNVTPVIDPEFASISDIKIELGLDFVKKMQ